MRNFAVTLKIVICLILLSTALSAQNTYELRKLSDEDWIGMSTEERLKALNVSNNMAKNQTHVGDFGRNSDLYQKWGYDYYEMEDGYENYAFRGFENYNIINDRRNKYYYNQFGDRLTKMTTSANIWTETYNDDGTSSIDRTNNYINDTSGVYVDGVWVARESTDDWAVSVIGADALRAKFTPLTLSLPNMAGIKVDFQSSNYEASYVSSLLSGTAAHSFFGRGSATKNEAMLMLRGGQFRRKFGALSLGATYVNMYSVQGSRDDGNSLKGSVTNYQPTALRYVVRILDDSPHDGDGPIISSVMLKVNGRLRPDIIPFIMKDDTRRELQTAIYNITQQNYMDYNATNRGEKEDYEPLNVIDRAPKYIDYMYMEDYVNGWNSKSVGDNFDTEKAMEYYEIVEPGGKPVQVNGTEYAVYIFNISSIPDKIRGVQAEITVANDYRIQTSKIFSELPTGRQDPDGSAYPTYYSATYWDTKAQADGNIKDNSNLRTLTVDFGYEVANIIYGVDAHFNYHGFKVDGEFVVNTHNYMFSDGYAGTGVSSTAITDVTPRSGDRYSYSDNAYYLVVQKDWKNFGFVGEYFKMGKFYRPHMKYMNPTVVAGRIGAARNSTQRMTLIADNDDDDQYADAMPYNMGMGSRVLTLRDPDGVFPGNDLDHDSIPDTDKNYNSIGDYNEPFLMLDSDPDEFVFGDDFNNNNIPDFREDDIKEDTPYDADRRGHHIYMRFSPQKNIDLILGSMRQRGVGLDNRNDDDYLKLRIKYNVLSIGNIFTEYRHNRIKDNIQDSYITVPNKFKIVQGAWGTEARYYNELYYDETEYRNSSVNKLFLQSKMRPISSFTLENQVKFERNYRIEGTAYDSFYQAEDIINTLAVSNKIVYTKQFGDFSISPGFKYRLYKKGYRESLNPRIHYTMQIPVLFLKYRVSPKTNITLGFQGMKGFETTYSDIIQNQNDYKQKNILLQIDNRTDYFGFEVWGGFGFQIEDFKFNEVYREFENYKTSSLFVRMWLGFE
ncbi:hypothetical protein ACFL2X_02855 [Candidatus Latescibacterota bacterium]